MISGRGARQAKKLVMLGTVRVHPPHSRPAGSCQRCMPNKGSWLTPPPHAHYLVFSLCALQLNTYVYELILHTYAHNIYAHIYVQLEADHLAGHFSLIHTHAVSPKYKVDHLDQCGGGPCAALLSIDLDIDHPHKHTPFCLAPGPGFGPSLHRSLQPALQSLRAVLCVGLAAQEGGCFLPPFSDTVIIVLQLSALIIVYKYCVFMGNW